MIEPEIDNMSKFQETLRLLGASAVIVGIPEDNDSRFESNITNSQLAYIHEYGAPTANIPPRPFLIPGIEQAEDSNLEIFQHYAKIALSLEQDATSDIEQMQEKIGENSVGFVQRAILEQDLIETGQLFMSIGYEIKDSND